MKRKNFIQNAVMGGAVAALGFPRWLRADNPVPLARPNILLIGVDDLRTELGCYGASHMSTPHIDALAAAGCRFERAYCQEALCTPSRTSVLTGLRPDQTGVHDLLTHFRTKLPSVLTLPQCFKEAGYFTAAFGKVFHEGLDDPVSWSVPTNGKGGLPRREIDHEGPYTSAENIRIVRTKRAALEEAHMPIRGRDIRGGPAEIMDVDEDQPFDARLTLSATDLIRRRSLNTDQPFFIAVGYRKPHLPVLAPRRYWDLYPESSPALEPPISQPIGEPSVAMTTWPELRAYAGIPQTGPLSDEQARTQRRGYFACISHTDHQVGLLMAALKENNLWENTIIVFWSDHGYHLGDKGLWSKQTNFEQALHVPLIVRMPGAPSSTSSLVCENVDIYPTLGELAGLKLPEHLAGASLAAEVYGDYNDKTCLAFSQIPRDHNGPYEVAEDLDHNSGSIMGYSVRNDQYRYTTWEEIGTGACVAEELYDYSEDKDERRNLVLEAGKQSLRDTLRESLNRESPRVFPGRRIQSVTKA